MNPGVSRWEEIKVPEPASSELGACEGDGGCSGRNRVAEAVGEIGRRVHG